MKKFFRVIPCVLLLAMLLSTSAGAVHDMMTWGTLDDASTFEEPYVDYESVFDKTQDLYLFSEYEADLKALQEQYPDLMRLEIAGYSELGRPIYVVVMGKDTAANRMLVMATTHAREYTGTQLSVLQIEFYLKNYYNTINGERVCDLMERCQFYFMPLHNPDGAMLTMIGLDSLDSPEVTASAEDKAEIEAFLLTQLEPMHTFCENNNLYHDTDDVPFSSNPDPERDDAFQYWKTNIRGVDLHNNMYTPWMMTQWKRSTWFNKNVEKNFTAPSWQDFTGLDEDDGIEAAAENRVLRDYVNKVKPNLLISYHTASNIIQWNFGYDNITGGRDLRSTAYKISTKAGELLNFDMDKTQYLLMGHAGWFMKNSTEYLDKAGYGAIIELADRRYLDGVAGYGAGYLDAPPIKTVQVTDDVVTTTGAKHYSLWTTGKFFPLSLSQYIMDNQMVIAAGPLSGDLPEGTEITSILGPAAAAPADADAEVKDFGIFAAPRKDKTTVIPGDILTVGKTPALYDATFSEQLESVEIDGMTPVCFIYENAAGKEIRGTFTAAPFLPISTVAGFEVQYDTTKSALLRNAAGGAIALPTYQETMTAADFVAKEGYTVVLSADSSFASTADSVALAEGQNTIYVAATDSASGETAHYTVEVVNPEAPVNVVMIALIAVAVLAVAGVVVVVLKKKKAA